MLTVSSSPLTTDRQSSRLGPVGLRFRSILVATDCTPTSTVAVKLGARLAKEFHSKLYVLHAIMPELYAVNMGGPIPELEILNRQTAHDNFHRYAERIPELRSVKHKELIFFGAAPDGIESVAKSHGIDLLVLGSHGRRGIAKLTLGSVPEWAIRRLNYPVLVAGPACEKTLRPTRSVLLATDTLQPSLRSVEYASSIAQEHNARLTFVTVLPGDHIREEQAETERSAVTQMQNLLPADCADWCTLNFEVKSGKIAPAILECAEHSKANMIVLGARHKPTLADHVPRTTLSAIMREARCPVLVIPDQPS